MRKSESPFPLRGKSLLFQHRLPFKYREILLNESKQHDPTKEGKMNFFPRSYILTALKRQL